MKTRVLLTMLIIFIVVAGVCITCGTVFVVREIEIQDVSVQEDRLTEEEKNNVIENCGLRGKNILFNISQDQVAKRVKAVNAELKVENVTAKFPNHVTITISRRVPIFTDNANHKVFDAEMCVVEGNPKNGGIDISGAKLKLEENLSSGDLAVGSDDLTKNKIQQLKVVASCKSFLTSLTKVVYDDDPGKAPSGCLNLQLTVGDNVLFIVKVKPTDDLRSALEYTQQIYQKVTHQAAGEYRTTYNEEKHGFLTVVYDVNENLINESRSWNDEE